MTSTSLPCFDRRVRQYKICRGLHWEGPAVLFLTAAVAFFLWPLWVAGYRFPKGSGDLWGQLYPVWSFVAEWVHRGIFPLWHNRMMGGDPILAEGQYGLLNPISWPLFLTNPIPEGLVLLRGAFSLWLAGTGLYLYLRCSPVWRLGRAAALTGAVAYMFSDPFIVHLGHPQFNDAMAWMPDKEFRPEEVAIVQNGPHLNGTGQGKIEPGDYGPNDLVLQVETDALALLVLLRYFLSRLARDS